MDSRETKRTVPYPSVGAGGEQPNSQICTTDSISEAATENNPQDESMEDILRELQRTSDPAYLHTVSMNELYQNVYQSRPPIIDGLRRLLVDNYSVFYVIREKQVIVTSVLYSASNIEQRLKERK